MKSCLVSVLLATFAHTSLSQESAFDRDPWPEEKDGPVKVFLLAGQSNMQGHASLRTLEYLIYQPETAGDYQHWKDRRGAWNERRDVWVWTTDGERSGYLKPGFGADEWKFGPELGFGWAAGERFSEQVLLIKTCWGGRSVKKDFLPPSEALPDDESLQLELERAQKRRPQTRLDDVKGAYGKAYRDMIHHTRSILENPKNFFPSYREGRALELGGLVWFQGWNDMVDGAQRKEGYQNYTKRLASMIRDLRRDLNAPDLPVIIGELGASDQAAFHAAQLAVTKVEDLKGTVRFVPTRRFWDPKLAKMVSDGVWKGPDWVQFYNHGSDRGYHYLGSGEIMMQIGAAFGAAVE